MPPVFRRHVLFTSVAVFDLKITKPNRASRALFKTSAALYASIIINFRKTVYDFDSIRWTITFTNTATDTADLAIRTNRFAVIA